VAPGVIFSEFLSARCCQASTIALMKTNSAQRPPVSLFFGIKCCWRCHILRGAISEHHCGRPAESVVPLNDRRGAFGLLFPSAFGLICGFIHHTNELVTKRYTESGGLARSHWPPD